VIALVGAAWLLIGPVHGEMQALLLQGNHNVVLLRVLAESGVAGILAVWVGSLMAARRELSAHGLDAAHEHGA